MSFGIDRMNVTPLLRTTQTASCLCRKLNCWTAAITKAHRKTYRRTYPTRLVLSDGSSINIEYDVPRMIITLPLNMDTISEEQRQARILARTPLSKVKIIDEIEDDFDESKYYKFRM